MNSPKFSTQSNSEEFIFKAKLVHGNKFDYSKILYINSKSKIKIICEKNHLFEQMPHSHLSGHGCPICRNESLKSNTDDFISKAKMIHGDKYDYSRVKYISSRKKVEIICKKHNIFKQSPNCHLNGRGCLECSYDSRKSNTDEFIYKAKIIHGDRYDYSKVKYIDSNKKIQIICNKHGEYFQTPNCHLNLKGCPKCSVTSRLTTEEFIRRARVVHGDKYDYNMVNYVNEYTKVKIICEKHGIFKQIPKVHNRSNGCSYCANELKIGNFSKNNWVINSHKSKKFDSYKIYIIKCFNDDENFYKIGKTYQTIKQRFGSKIFMPYNYEIISIFTHEDGKYISEFEHKLHKQHKNFKYIPKISFAGESECFSKIINHKKL